MPSSSTDVLNFVKRSCHCTALSQILIHNRLNVLNSLLVQWVTTGCSSSVVLVLVELLEGFARSLPGLGLALICRTAAAVRALATRQLHRAPKRATKTTDQKL